MNVSVLALPVCQWGWCRQVPLPRASRGIRGCWAQRAGCPRLPGVTAGPSILLPLTYANSGRARGPPRLTAVCAAPAWAPGKSRASGRPRV